MATLLPLQQAPEGTKLWLMNLGYLEADIGFLIRGGGASSKSNPNPDSQRIKGVVISALIEHPTEGLILFETGSGADWPDVWGSPMNDLFAQVDYIEEQDLDKAIEKTGHDIKDVTAVIMGHLHVDHAGGLEYFKDTNVPIWVHEIELKHAFWSVATKTDIGAYLPQHLNIHLNWKTFSGDFIGFAPGIFLIHSPGHTPGLTVMQLNLRNSGHWLFTTDQYHIKENFDLDTPQGWLARDHSDWHRSNQKIKMYIKNVNPNIIFGHDIAAFDAFKHAPDFYD